MADWKACIFERLRVRNATERDAFKSVFASYERLLSAYNALRTRNIQLEQEAAQLRSAESTGRLSVAASGNVQALEEKILRLQEELTASYRLNAENTNTMLRLKLQAERDEKALLAKEQELAAKTTELERMVAERDERELQLKQLQESFDLLKKSHDDSMRLLKETEAKVQQLAAENNDLIQRILQIKEEQAKELNMVNDMYNSLMKAAQQNTELMKQVEEKKKALPVVESLDSSAILDALAWQSNFCVSIPKNRKATIRAHTGSATAVRINSAGTLALTGGTDSVVRVWDTRSCQAKGMLRGVHSAVMSVSFNHNDTLALASGNDQMAYIWSLRTSRIEHTLTGHTQKVWASAFNLEGDRAITGSHDRTIRFWDVTTGSSVRTVHCGSACNNLSVSPNGNIMASAHLNSHIRIWSARTGESIHDLTDIHTQQATCVDFSRDGTQIVTNSRDNTLKVVDVRTWKVLMILRGAPKVPYKCGVNWARVSFSPDGQYVIAGSTNGDLLIWNATSGALESILAPTGTAMDEKEARERIVASPSPSASSVAGASLLSGSLSSAFDTSTEVPSTTVCGLVWNRNGRQIISVQYDGNMSIWNA